MLSISNNNVQTPLTFWALLAVSSNSNSYLTSPHPWRKLAQGAAVLLTLAGPLLVTAVTPAGAARGNRPDAAPIKSRHMDKTRERATRRPRGVNDQALINGWPLYRTDRGQAAFNHAMATLKVTDGRAPALQAFKGCTALNCKLTLPSIGSDGWIPAGRLWVSPKEYVLFVHSPRRRRGGSYRRRRHGGMRYFVFHEFQNSTRNTDPYDTISAHSGSVFVPFYMSKRGTDARGQRFVIVVQVAPYDVRSVHASNKGSNGPGIEVAKNTSGSLETLQGLAGVLVATIVKKAASHLRVVNHRGAEGRPMLRAYDRRLKALRGRSRSRSVTLPFMPAPRARVARATSRLGDLIKRSGVSPSKQLAERQNITPRAPIRTARATVHRTKASAPTLPQMSPLAAYLRTNIATLKRLPGFSDVIPAQMASIGEVASQRGVVYLLDANGGFLGAIEALMSQGVAVNGRFTYTSYDLASRREIPFALDLSRPLSLTMASLGPGSSRDQAPRLINPIQPVSQPASSGSATMRDLVQKVLTPGASR